MRRVLLALAIVATFLVPSAVNANHDEDVCVANAGDPSTCGGFHWHNYSADVWVFNNPAGQAKVTEMQRAVVEWNQTSDFPMTLVYRGRTEHWNPGVLEREIVVIFDQDGIVGQRDCSGTAGCMAYILKDSSTDHHHLLSVRIIINLSLAIDEPCDQGGTQKLRTIEQLLLHELGHAVGVWVAENSGNYIHSTNPDALMAQPRSHCFSSTNMNYDGRLVGRLFARDGQH